MSLSWITCDTTRLMLLFLSPENKLKRVVNKQQMRSRFTDFHHLFEIALYELYVPGGNIHYLEMNEASRKQANWSAACDMYKLHLLNFIHHAAARRKTRLKYIWVNRLFGHLPDTDSGNRNLDCVTSLLLNLETVTNGLSNITNP